MTIINSPLVYMLASDKIPRVLLPTNQAGAAD